MPLMTCPKCKRFHYVPGECPAPATASAVTPAPLPRMADREGGSRKDRAEQADQVTPRFKTGDKKSTAARKDVPNVEADTFPPRHTHPQVVSQDRGGRDAVIAGTQAPPVDTLKTAEASAAHLAPAKRGKGRPRNGFDKKAHDRAKAKERRDRLKAEGKAK